MEKSNAASLGLAVRYWRLFVNRLAYTMQSEKPGRNGKHYYYKPKDGRRLSRETVLEHLNGQITIGIYPINPETQRSSGWPSMPTMEMPWKTCSSCNGNCSGTELRQPWRSRAAAGTYGYSRKNPCWHGTAESTSTTWQRRLKVPVKGGAGLAEGIEVFPRQDELGDARVWQRASRASWRPSCGSDSAFGSTARITDSKRNSNTLNGSRKLRKPR